MTIRIHQIFYSDDQLPRLDPAFLPFDNRSNECPEWREYHVFRTAYRAGACREGDITGFVSWKFGMKTGVPGKAFVDFIARHPGHDVYFLNPTRVERRVFPNIWRQGESHHPGILSLAQRIFDAVGVDVDLAMLAQPQSHILYCNYWAGTRDFWDIYMSFCEPIRAHIENGLSPPDIQLVRSRADAVIDACYIPFIIERLFSTLLTLRPNIRFMAFPARSGRAFSSRWLGRMMRSPSG